jgi:hypothetical protein
MLVRGVAEGVAVLLGVGDGDGLTVGFGVVVAEGVDSKAGSSSAAWTTKFLVKVLKTPWMSRQVMVIL